MAETDPLVVFTPSGRRGRFPVGTPVLQAARSLGVDLDSVCGGRGICSKCQITPAYGDFPKHGVTVRDDALSEWNKVEQRYDDKRGLKPGRRLGRHVHEERRLLHVGAVFLPLVNVARDAVDVLPLIRAFRRLGVFPLKDLRRHGRRDRLAAA